jgi:hypothetical protein
MSAFTLTILRTNTMTNTQNEVSTSTAVINEQVLESIVAAETPAITQVRSVSRAKAREGFSPEIITILKRPLPSVAISKGQRGLDSIKAIFVAERLNEAFGEGRWYTKSERIERVEGGKQGIMIVSKTVLVLLDYPWFYAESAGGHENADLGDSYKGATTDALSKICAVQFGLGIDVYKGHGSAPSVAFEKAEAAAVKAAANATPKEQKDAKAAMVAAEVKTDQGTVANPPDCADCLLKEPKVDAKITTWEHPTNGKKYDAADLVKQSQKKYQLDLCATCQSARAAELKAKTNRVQ